MPATRAEAEESGRAKREIEGGEGRTTEGTPPEGV